MAGAIRKTSEMCTIVITGHRPHRLGTEYKYPSVKMERIRSQMEKVIQENNCTKLIIGMAMGVDTLGAMIAITFKIPFIAAVPFHGQELNWFQPHRATYYDLLCNAESVKYVHADEKFKPYKFQSGYLSQFYQDRNEWMVDQLSAPNDLVLSVWDGKRGGTKNCIEYARSKTPKLRMTNINPITFEITQLQ